MNTQLAALATALNTKLAHTEYRWELDMDGESNSVGTYFCGDRGGVTTARGMREYTAKLLGRYPRPSHCPRKGNYIHDSLK